MTKPIFASLVFLLLMMPSCAKDEVKKEPEILSEIIYGRWELREELSFLRYRDFDFHEISFEDLPILEFIEPDSFNISFELGFGKSGYFEIKEADSILEYV